MSLYRQGAGGEPTAFTFTPHPAPGEEPRGPIGATPFVPPSVTVFNTDEQSTFWKAIKWGGAILTIWVGYEKVKELYDKHLSADRFERRAVEEEGYDE